MKNGKIGFIKFGKGRPRQVNTPVVTKKLNGKKRKKSRQQRKLRLPCVSAFKAQSACNREKSLVARGMLK